jgi:cysteinyl-tRNA synthetase
MRDDASGESNAISFFNSLHRRIDRFQPEIPGRAKIYSCGPTVYSFQHIGNMRAYCFTDTLSRVLKYFGYRVTHIINITDVGHLTSDADTGEDKIEKASSLEGRTAFEIARFYTEAFWWDLGRLNLAPPTQWVFATDHIAEMIAFAEKIAPQHCYMLDSGLYFDVTTVPDYGRLARTTSSPGERRIDEVEGKRHPADFAIWRRSPVGENREMEWDSPWGRGAPGWHLECSVMSMNYLGERFDIHTGGIDHREIHHPNEIAQNQAYTCSSYPGAAIWMHNNFLVDRSGKLSKSVGGALLLDDLVQRGFHLLGFRMMCLQAHYRSPLEFSFDGLAAASARFKRIVIAIEGLRNRETEDPKGSASDSAAAFLKAFEREIADDLMMPRALPVLEEMLSQDDIPPAARLQVAERMDAALGLGLATITRKDLRVRPAEARLSEREIESTLEARKAARALRDFARADRLRAELEADGVVVMDGDPLGWEWRIGA